MSTYKILLLGETGSGKTSFLNLLCNCYKMKTMSDNYDERSLSQLQDFNDACLEDGDLYKLAQSRTSGVKIYQGDRCDIIDTPGLGDSRGLEQDNKFLDHVISRLKAEKFINCICLIINGQQTQLGMTSKYVFAEITAFLPREVVNNVIVVITNTSNPCDVSFDLIELQTLLGKPIIDNLFYIENPYCHLTKVKHSKLDKFSVAVVAEVLQKHFREANRMLDNMWSTIKCFGGVCTKSFVRTYSKRHEIEGIFQTLIESRKAEGGIKLAEERLSDALKRKELNANFQSTKTSSKPIMVLTYYVV